MKTFLTVFLCFIMPLLAQADEGSTIKQIDFPKADVREVLSFYERLTGKPVFVRLGFGALVTIQRAEPSSAEGAANLIRTTLLERYGIELRTSASGETVANWSQDAKYPRRSDEAMTEAERSSRASGKVRVIRP